MLPGVGVFGTGKLLEAVVPHLRSLGFRVVALWGQTLDDAGKVAGETENRPCVKVKASLCYGDDIQGDWSWQKGRCYVAWCCQCQTGVVLIQLEKCVLLKFRCTVRVKTTGKLKD